MLFAEVIYICEIMKTFIFVKLVKNDRCLCNTQKLAEPRRMEIKLWAVRM